MYDNIYNLFVFISCCYASIALDRFIDKKLIWNQEIKVINENKSYIWIEYYYQFYKTDIYKNTNRKLNLVTEESFSDNYKKDFASFLQKTQDVLQMKIKYLQTDFTSGNSSNDVMFSNWPVDFNIDSTECILPIIDSKFVLIYKPEKISSTKDIFIITFTGTMWLIFFCILIIAVVAFRICTKHYHIVYQDHFLWTWIDITFWAIAASCQQGVSYAPYKFASCLIFLLVYMLAYLLYTVFTARITSTLLQETSVSIVTDKTKLKFVTLNLTNMTESNISMEKVAAIEDMFLLLENKDTVGILPKILLQQYMSRANDINDFYNIIDLPYRYKIIMLVHKTTYQNTLTKQRMISLLESGLLRKSFNGLFRYGGCKRKARYYKADFDHIKSAVLLFYAGVGISLVLLAAEFIIAYCKHFY